MSDYAYSCEYISAEKTCLAALENPKAENSRQQNCLNSEKLCCCYICTLRSQCSVKCRYLGDTENQPKEPEPVQLKAEKLTEPAEVKVNNAQAAVFCPLCNIEMSPKKAQLTLSSEKEQTMQVVAYVCPSCRRIELKAEN